MTRKCTRCFIPMDKLGTFYISNTRRALPSIPLFAYECPRCGRIEFTKVKEK